MYTPEKLINEAGFGELPQALGNIGGRALQAVLLQAYRIRVSEIKPADVLRQYETSDLTKPCSLDQREIIKFEGSVGELIPLKFKLVELSPTTAIGSNSVLANVSQNNVLGTTRNTEVVGDGVTVLALEAAKRRKTLGVEALPIHLGTFHRETRTQKHEAPGFTSHFHALSLVSSKKTNEPNDFKSDAFADHTSIYLDIIRSAGEIGYSTQGISVALSNVRILELIMKHQGIDKAAVMRRTQTPEYDAFKEYGVNLPSYINPEDLPNLISDLPNELRYLARPLAHMGRMFSATVSLIAGTYGDSVRTFYDLSRHSGIGYYQDAAVKISATNAEGETYPLVDIGSNDWMVKLLNHKDERLVTGGMGTELFMKKFTDRTQHP